MTDTRWGFVDDAGADWFWNEYAINVFSDPRLSPISGVPEDAYVYIGSAGYGQGQRVAVLARVGLIVIDLGLSGEFDATSGRNTTLPLLSAATQRTQEALAAAP